MLLTLRRDVLPPKQGVEAENRVRYAGRKKKSQQSALWFIPLSKDISKAPELEGPRGVSVHSQTRLFLAQDAADVHSDQEERRGNTHTD